MVVKVYPRVSAEYKVAVEEAGRKLRDLIIEKDCAWLMVALG